MESESWAFIDEYGDPNLGTEVAGRTHFFIVAAIVVDGEVISSVRAQLEDVRKAHFQKGPMKSKNLASDRGRWLRVLSSLSTVPFGFYGLVIDKRRIDKSSGLQWRESFYKNICSRAYTKLMRAYPSLHVRADRYGDEVFKSEFGAYMKARRPSLFDAGTFEFVDDRADVFVQAADVMCGMLARCYDAEKQLERPEELLRMMSRQALVVDEWPPRFRLTAGRSELVSTSGPDALISEYGLRQAEEFIAKHEESRDEDVACQVAILERLVLERRLGEGGHIQSGALIDNLRHRGLKPKDVRWLQTSLIAKLRDRGVLITSSSAGYKLPSSANDVTDFVRHAENVCVPMLNRAAAAVDAVKLVTKGKIDVLNEPSLAAMRRLIEAASDDA